MANWKVWINPHSKTPPADTTARGKRRRRKPRATGRGGLHGRTMTFFNSAARRLAWNDYEKVSVAMICRDARSTPYTFYRRRFPSKRAFFYYAVLVTFRERTRAFNEVMKPKAWKKATPQAIVYRLVDEVIANTLTVPTIGMTQLAVRIAMSKPKGAEPYLEFRAAIMNRAVKLLSRKLKIQNPKEAIRKVMQMVLAMATDEAWRHGIPFTTERKRELVESYSNLVFRCLQLPPGRRDPQDVGANHSEMIEFPEHLQTAYGINKPALKRYEKAVNSSQKPKFKLDIPVKPEDAVILMTRAEDRKTEKPLKREKKPKRVYKMI